MQSTTNHTGSVLAGVAEEEPRHPIASVDQRRILGDVLSGARSRNTLVCVGTNSLRRMSNRRGRGRGTRMISIVHGYHVLDGSARTVREIEGTQLMNGTRNRHSGRCTDGGSLAVIPRFLSILYQNP